MTCVVERLGQRHRDGEPLVLCPSTESSLLATEMATEVVYGGREGRRRPQRGGDPSAAPPAALLVLVRCLSGDFIGPFGDLLWRSPVGKGALRTTITGEGGTRLTTCGSQSFKRVVECASSCPDNPKEAHPCRKQRKIQKMKKKKKHWLQTTRILSYTSRRLRFACKFTQHTGRWASCSRSRRTNRTASKLLETTYIRPHENSDAPQLFQYYHKTQYHDAVQVFDHEHNILSDTELVVHLGNVPPE